MQMIWGLEKEHRGSFGGIRHGHNQASGNAMRVRKRSRMVCLWVVSTVAVVSCSTCMQQ
jgi:hypothetical protein